MIGFTSTFQQNVPSLALARRWKAAAPGTTIAFGGANWEADAGVAQLECFDFVDIASLGEADHTVALLARAVAEGSELATIPGIAHRDGGSVRRSLPAEPVADLDTLPVPDHDDWMDQLRASGLEGSLTPHLGVETSRGCWWGAHSHCTFCGLNGGGMAFRSKHPDRVHDELHALRERHGVHRIEMVDNILDTRYFRSLLPRLAAERAAGDPGFDIFYEIKANLTHSQLRALAAAGCTRVQPGIESLSDHVLTLMRKGSTGLQNLQVLRWMFELGLVPDWNVLWGFPGETEQDYLEMADLIDAVMFLPPPISGSAVRVDRFSPFFERPEAFGLVDLRPFPGYRSLYPFPEEVVASFAYYFTHRYADGRDELGPAGPVRDAVERWRSEGDPGGVWMQAADDGTVRLVDDRRSTPRRRELTWHGWRAELYLACDRARTVAEMEAVPALDALDPADRDRFLAWCVHNRLMVTDGSRWLSLAVHTPARTDTAHPGLRHVNRVPWRVSGPADALRRVEV